MLGACLLQRTTIKQMLTNEEELIYQSSLQILNNIRKIEQQLLHKNTIVSGKLKITAPTSLDR